MSLGFKSEVWSSKLKCEPIFFIYLKSFQSMLLIATIIICEMKLIISYYNGKLELLDDETVVKDNHDIH